MDQSQREAFVRRMTTPPPNQEATPPRTSFDAFSEVFTELKADGEAQILAQSERAKELWDASNSDV
jgi:hypothetical protein